MKNKKVIALITAVTLASATAFGIGGVTFYKYLVSRNEVSVADVSDALSDSLTKDIQAYISSYVVSRDGENAPLVSQKDSALIATSVAKECKTYLAEKPTLSQTEINTLQKIANDTVVTQTTALANNMDSVEYDNFLISIDCLVTADTYKAISDSHLVSQSTLDVLRQQVSADLSTLSDSITVSQNNVSKNVASLNNIVTALSGGAVTDASKNLSSISAEMNTMREFLNEYKAGNIMTETQRGQINGILDSLQAKIGNEEASISAVKDSVDKLNIVDVRNTITSILNTTDSLGKKAKLTDEQLEDLRQFALNIEKERKDSDENSLSIIKENTADIAELEEKIDSQKNEYSVLKDNLFELTTIIKNSGEYGSSPNDRALVELCNLVSEQVAAATVLSNSELKSQISSIQKNIESLQTEIEFEKAGVETTQASMKETLAVMETSIEKIDDVTVTTLNSWKSLLEKTQEDLSNEQSIEAEHLKDSINKTLEAIDNTIDAKSEKNEKAIQKAKKELSSALEDVNISLNSEISSLQAILDDQSAELESAKQYLSLSLNAMSGNLSTLQDEVTQFEKDINAKVSENYNTLSSELTDKTTELNNLKASREELGNVEDSLKKANSELETTLTTKLSDESTTREEKLAETQKALDDAKTALEGSLSQLSTSTANSLKESVQTLEKAIADAGSDASSDLSDVEESLKELISSTKTAIDGDLASQIANVEFSISATNTTITNLKNELTTNLSELQQELVGQIKDVKDELIDKTNELNNLKASKEELELTKESLLNADESLSNAMKIANEGLVAMLSTENATREQQIAEAKAARDILEQTINNNIDSLSESAKNSLADARNELSDAIALAEENSDSSIDNLKTLLSDGIAALDSSLGTEASLREQQLAAAELALEALNSSLTENMSRLESSTYKDIQDTATALSLAIDKVKSDSESSLTDLNTSLTNAVTELEGTINNSITSKLSEVNESILETNNAVTSIKGDLDSEKAAREKSEEEINSSISELQKNVGEQIDNLNNGSRTTYSFDGEGSDVTVTITVPSANS